MDVTNQEQIQEAVAAGVQKFGHIDVLINNAGFGMNSALEEVSDHELRMLFHLNFKSLCIYKASLSNICIQSAINSFGSITMAGSTDAWHFGNAVWIRAAFLYSSVHNRRGCDCCRPDSHEPCSDFGVDAKQL